MVVGGEAGDGIAGRFNHDAGDAEGVCGAGIAGDDEIAADDVGTAGIFFCFARGDHDRKGIVEGCMRVAVQHFEAVHIEHGAVGHANGFAKDAVAYGDIAVDTVPAKIVGYQGGVVGL